MEEDGGELCFAIPLKLTAGQLKTLMGKLLTTLLLTPNIPERECVVYWYSI
jgi:hypothetical protein